MTSAPHPAARSPGAIAACAGALVRLAERHHMALLLAVLALALAARLAALAVFANTDPQTANLWEYGSIARLGIEHGQLLRLFTFPDGSSVLAPTAYMPPVHVGLWLGAFSLLGITSTALGAMLAVNLLGSMATVLLTWMIAWSLTRSRLACLAATGIVALYPTFVVATATYPAVNLYSPVFLLLVVVVLRLRRPLSPIAAVLLGALGAVCILYRTEYVPFVGLLFLVMALITRRARDLFVPALVCVLLVTPWAVRNYLVFDRVIPVANVTGYGLWKGFNPEADGSGNHVEAIGAAWRQVGAELMALPRDDPHFESLWDDVFKRAALDFMREQPSEAFLVLPIKKILLFWGADITDREIVLRPEYLGPLVITSALALAGLVVAWRRRPIGNGHLLVLALFALQTLIMAVYAVHARYRMNMEPFLFAYAGLAVAALLEHLAGRPEEKEEEERKDERALPSRALQPGA